MTDQEYVTVGEFTRAMESLNRQIDSGFSEIRERSKIQGLTMDRIETLVMTHETKFAVLESRANDATNTARKWGTAMAAVATALVEAARAYLHKGA